MRGRLPNRDQRSCRAVHSPIWPRVRTLDRIFTRLRGHDDVWWTRKGPDRPVGPRPPRHRRLGRPRPRPGQRPAGTQRM